MLEPKSVAICIPTFNQAQYLIESVVSACSQTYLFTEVWVSDDASTDNTTEVMTELDSQYPGIKYHRQKMNQGIAANNTWLLSQPQADYIVRLDSDDVLHPEYVKTLVGVLNQYPNAGYAHTAVHEINSRSEHQRIRRVARSKEFQDSETALRASVSGYRTAANILMFRSDALRKLHYYEGRPEFTEDYDLSIRMADAGYGNVYIDRPLAAYRVWNDSDNKRLKRKKIQLLGLIRIFEESLLPAFERRNWDMRPISNQRRYVAKMNATFCCSPLFTRQERAELIQLLIKLGDSRSLRFRLLLTTWNLGCIFDCNDRAKYWLKRVVKDVLSRIRNGNLNVGERIHNL